MPEAEVEEMEAEVSIIQEPPEEPEEAVQVETIVQLVVQDKRIPEVEVAAVLMV